VPDHQRPRLAQEIEKRLQDLLQNKYKEILARIIDESKGRYITVNLDSTGMLDIDWDTKELLSAKQQPEFQAWVKQKSEMTLKFISGATIDGQVELEGDVCNVSHVHVPMSADSRRLSVGKQPCDIATEVGQQEATSRIQADLDESVREYLKRESVLSANINVTFTKTGEVDVGVEMCLARLPDDDGGEAMRRQMEACVSKAIKDVTEGKVSGSSFAEPIVVDSFARDRNQEVRNKIMRDTLLQRMVTDSAHMVRDKYPEREQTRGGDQKLARLALLAWLEEYLASGSGYESRVVEVKDDALRRRFDELISKAKAEQGR